MISLIQDFVADFPYTFHMESQPLNPEFRNNPENFHPWTSLINRQSFKAFALLVYADLAGITDRVTDRHMDGCRPIHTDKPKAICLQ